MISFHDTFYTAFLLVMMAGATEQLTGLVCWALFAQHARGTVVGVRERLGKDFVAVYRYTDHRGVTQQAMSSLGSRKLGGKHTGAAFNLRVFPSRPEIVREARGILHTLMSGFLCSLLLLILVPFFARSNLFSTFLVAHGLPWGKEAATTAAIVLGIVSGRPGKPADAHNNLGPLEAAENVSAERISALEFHNTYH